MTKELLVVSQGADFFKKINKYDYSIDVLNSLDEIDIEIEYLQKAVIIDGRKLNYSELAGSCQVGAQVIRNSKIVLVVSSKITNSEIGFLYQSGVNLILSENDYFNSRKLEFYLSHYLYNQYYPVKSYDFEVNTYPEFKVFHLLAFRGTFVPVIYGNISPEKMERLKSVNELYIKREDVEKFSQYLKQHPANSAEKIFSRCRANYLSFSEQYVNLLFKVTDESKNYSFEEGRQLLEETKKAAKELLMTLAAAPNPWLIVNNLASENQHPISRIPSVAAYVGIISLELDFPNPEDLMLATLLSDVGLLALSSSDTEEHHLHPLKSVNLVLERKLPLDEFTKKIILFSHENCTGTGFPKGRDVNPNKIPLESQLLQICQFLDEKSIIKKGQLRPDLNEVKKDLILELLESRKFDLTLVHKLKTYWKV
jgi:response regulator RpfG family c-di-GMP phosphodiesterase